MICILIIVLLVFIQKCLFPPNLQHRYFGKLCSAHVPYSYVSEGRGGTRLRGPARSVDEGQSLTFSCDPRSLATCCPDCGHNSCPTSPQHGSSCVCLHKPAEDWRKECHCHWGQPGYRSWLCSKCVSSYRVPKAAFSISFHFSNASSFLRFLLSPQLEICPSFKSTGQVQNNKTKGGDSIRWKMMVLENHYFAILTVTESGEILGWNVVGEQDSDTVSGYTPGVIH